MCARLYILLSFCLLGFASQGVSHHSRTTQTEWQTVPFNLLTNIDGTHYRVQPCSRVRLRSAMRSAHVSGLSVHRVDVPTGVRAALVFMVVGGVT